jgi:L-alanine-DL-glutamate epimerase-like enolase superfamily enzyme
MQITHAEVIPAELSLRQPACLANRPPVRSINALFLRLETRDGYNAWGCAVAEAGLDSDSLDALRRACQAGADRAPDLHPTHIEYSLAELAPLLADFPAALCAFDLAFHDLLGLAAGMPLYRLLGGYRDRVQTSATIPVASVEQSVELARGRADQGFRMLKIKGGCDPEEDAARVRAIHRALPGLMLRLDADGGYTVKDALEVARALGDRIEILEQPTPFDDLQALQDVTRHSSVPVLADQSVHGPDSALSLAAGHCAHGLSVKLAACGGLGCARQIDAIARAARLATMVNCLIEPALMTAAGLSFALSSPNVRYSDLDGFLDLLDDPTRPTFRLESGWLIASDVPGLGCTVELG